MFNANNSSMKSTYNTYGPYNCPISFNLNNKSQNIFCFIGKELLEPFSLKK